MIDLVNMRSEFINGNLDGLKIVYKLYKEDVTTILRSKSHSSYIDTEEYFSQALIVFYENLMKDRDNNIKSVKNYLVGICLNKLKTDSLYKSKFKQKSDEVRTLLYEYQEYDSTANYRNELKNICKDALEQLDKKCSKIICSYYLDKLSMRDIAQNLKLSSSDVAKTLKSRCFKKLIEITKKIKSERITY